MPQRNHLWDDSKWGNVVIFLNHYGNDPQLVVWTGRQLEEIALTKICLLH